MNQGYGNWLLILAGVMVCACGSEENAEMIMDMEPERQVMQPADTMEAGGQNMNGMPSDLSEEPQPANPGRVC